MGRCAAELAADAAQVCIAGGSESARQAAQEVLGHRLAAWDALDPACPDHAILALDAAATLTLCRRMLCVDSLPADDEGVMPEQIEVQDLHLPSFPAIIRKASHRHET